MLAKLSHALTVSIWRLPNVRYEREWSVFRSCTLAGTSSYGEAIRPNVLAAADCNNNAGELNYNSLLMMAAAAAAADGWPMDCNSLASDRVGTTPAASTSLAFANSSLSLIQTMCSLFANMEQSLDELCYTFTNIVDTVGATSVPQTIGSNVPDDEPIQH
ncbi:uncharacterized protein LOC118512286 [Anopheles stephensi]|uniref:uncharacterized protein LOC118512286 n=1 Tax=Anopheles stephensi TaxID=30069 RepID=UPI0016589204|nr:uncharacterized protein LOC118512286 [Anopheles stephensi]